MAFDRVGDEVDFGGKGKFNINTTTAKGLEKVIGVVSRFTINANYAVNEVLYGKWQLQNEGETNGIKKILDRGVVDALDKFAEVNFCKLFTYLIDQIDLPGLKFDPNKLPPDDATPFERKKWNLQKKAYDYQKKIDDYYKSYGDATSGDSKLGLLGLIAEVLLAFDELLGPNALGDKELKSTFPETTLAINYLENVRDKFLRYTNVRTIPIEEVQDILKYIDGTRQFLVVIQSLNDPKQLISFANNLTGGVIDQEIQDLNKSFKPDKFIDLINGILNNAQKINNIAKKIVSYINLTRTVIKILILLIKVFRILIAAIRTIALAIPAVFTSAGTSFEFSKTYQDFLKSEGLDKFVKRLNQINLSMGLMAALVTTIIIAIDGIINKLSIILLNLEGCQRKPDDLVKNIANTIKELQETKIPLKEFIDGINNKSSAENTTFGTYTIQIIKEELVDEGISLRRRYGIARGSDGIIAAQSTPTFATLDEIIINEVKVQLVSKGLVNQGLSDLSPETTATIVESMKYLGEEDDIDMNTNISLPEEDNDLREFSNNLPGGRALRIKTRRKLIKENEKIAKDLKSSDPEGKFTSKIISKKTAENNQLRIKNLEDEKKGLQIKLAASAAIPGGQLALVPIIKRIKEIDTELQKLKTG